MALNKVTGVRISLFRLDRQAHCIVPLCDRNRGHGQDNEPPQATSVDIPLVMSLTH